MAGVETRLLPFALSAGLVALTGFLIVAGRGILIPLAIAIMVWYLINALTRIYGQIPVGGERHLPRWLCLAAALVTFLTVLGLLVDMIGGNIVAVSDAAPIYQANLERMIAYAAGLLGFSEVPSLAQIYKQVDFRQIIGSLAGAAAGIASDAGIVVIYVLFLMIEQTSFDKKLSALFPDADKKMKARGILIRMQAEIQTYVWIKTLMSLLTGGVSYIILILVGVDQAEFWALIIFLLNYIPTIGSLLGIVFPAFLTLVQFETPGPFFIVVVGLTLVQMFVGNVIEPRMMGTSLNLSALVVILSLALWGTLWGVAGMFLCVPITVITTIILAQFQYTRPIAIMLSSDGNVK